MSIEASELKVLLIEDDPADQQLTSEILEEAYPSGLQLTCVENWRQGFEELTEHVFDVCLLDYRLGERTGVEIVREAKQRGITTPIILLTSQGNREIDIEAMRAGASDYLEKSRINPVLLERSIRYAIMENERIERCTEEIDSERPKLLLVEDDEDDYFLTNELLRDIYGPNFELDWVRTEDDAIAAIAKAEHDVYLVDYRLGKTNGIDLVRELSETAASAPFILLTGQNSRELDFEAMRAGASDYLVKSDITAPLLDRAIRYAIERHRGERELARLAQFDQLTGLANRFLFRDYLERALARASRSDRTVAVFFLDLDRFKIINDTFGHETGDELLEGVAERLKHSVRASDIVARLGGDEFTVVVDGVTGTDVIYHFADRILRVLREPMQIGENEVYTTASIGIALYPNDATNVDDLLRSADAAMYKAKEEGSDNYQFYTVDLHIRAARRSALERGLRSAIDRSEFEVWYQPQLCLSSGDICGLEALIRWNKPDEGLVMPDAFIGLAEETGLIVPIGEQVIDQACRKVRELVDRGAKDFTMAVNFSARQFQAAKLAETVADIIASHEIDPSFLEIEITENSILEDPQTVRRTLETLTELGVKVALDDFGTGYSSLKHLRSFPAGSIKVDKSFIQNVCDSPEDASIVRAIVGMAHNLRLKVIAEGVETQEQLSFLRELDCDTGQGYYFSKPLHPDDANALVLPGMNRGLYLPNLALIQENEEQEELASQLIVAPALAKA